MLSFLKLCSFPSETKEAWTEDQYISKDLLGFSWPTNVFLISSEACEMFSIWTIWSFSSIRSFVFSCTCHVQLPVTDSFIDLFPRLLYFRPLPQLLPNPICPHSLTSNRILRPVEKEWTPRLQKKERFLLRSRFGAAFPNLLSHGEPSDGWLEAGPRRRSST